MYRLENENERSHRRDDRLPNMYETKKNKVAESEEDHIRWEDCLTIDPRKVERENSATESEERK